MCFDLDSRPPIPPIAGGAIDTEEIVLRAGDGGRFAGLLARAEKPSGAAMIVLPDVRGLHPYYEELALRFAEAGVDALAIDYFGRTAGIGIRERPTDFDFMSHVGETRFSNLSWDVRAAAERLRALEPAGTSGDALEGPGRAIEPAGTSGDELEGPGRAIEPAGTSGDELEGPGRVRAVFTIGFCFGGRLAFLANTLGLDLAGSIGFYGWPVGARGDIPAPADSTGLMTAPVLAIFGGADKGIPPEAVETFRDALAATGIPHEVVTYPAAPHSFFDRKAEDFADASADTWERVLAFIRTNTPV